MMAEAAPFRLLVITPEGPYPQEAQWVNRLFENGLETLHLRKPGWNEQQLRAFLGQVEECHHPQIMLHGSASLLSKVRVKGVHFQQHTLPQAKPAYSVSCSVHTWQELLLLEERVDYAFVSPFFNSISKKGYAANPSLQVVPSHARRQKAVALGGIDCNTIEKVRGMGIGGAAILGAVWQTADPLAAYLRCRKS